MPKFTQYTITVAGVERLDGEAPYVYVVHTVDQLAAEIMATTEHDRYEREDLEVPEDELDYDGPTVVPEQSYAGSPDPRWGLMATLVDIGDGHYFAEPPDDDD